MTNFNGVCIFGKMGAGKTTLAHEVARQLLIRSEPVHIAAFGDRLKEQAKQYMKEGQNERRAWQAFGQSIRQIFGHDVWIRELEKYLDPRFVIIIHDARQLNELQWAKSAGLLTVGVHASEFVRGERLKARDGYDQSAYFSHGTEEQAGESCQCCDYKVDNDTTSIGELIRHGETIADMVLGSLLMRGKISEQTRR